MHGTPGNAAEQRNFLYNVPEGIEFVSVDRPGFGETKPRKVVTSLDAQTAAILPVILPVLEERDGVKTVLVGHSLGGPVVAAVVANYPDKVGAIIQVVSAMDPALEDAWTIQYA